MKSHPKGNDGIKGPVELMHRVKIAHSFSVCVKPVPLYYFKLAYVVIRMAVKNFSKPVFKNGESGRFNQSLLMKSS